MEPVTVTIEGACKALGVGRTTLYELIAASKLVKVVIGGRSLIATASIRALVDDAVSSDLKVAA